MVFLRVARVMSSPCLVFRDCLCAIGPPTRACRDLKEGLAVVFEVKVCAEVAVATDASGEGVFFREGELERIGRGLLIFGVHGCLIFFRLSVL